MKHAISAKQNFFQNSMEVRMTHFNVSVPGRENNNNVQNM